MPDLTGNAAIDTAVGLFFVFFILSIVCSAIQEMIAGWFNLRARDLERGVRNLLDGQKGKAEAFFDNPRVRALWREAGFRDARKPSYIPARVAALTFLDTVAPPPEGSSHDVLATVRARIATLKDEIGKPDTSAIKDLADAVKSLEPHVQSVIDPLVAELEAASDDGDAAAAKLEEVKQALAKWRGSANRLGKRRFKEPLKWLDVVERSMNANVIQAVLTDALGTADATVGGAQAKVAALRKQVETAFDEAMDRASGWYKRRAQVILLVIALAVAGITNADSLAITQRLYKDDALRAAVVAQADQVTQNACPGVTATDPAQKAAECVDSVQALGLPFGWNTSTLPDRWEWIGKVLGLLLTAAALSLGAPFWFDALGKLAQLRGVGNREGTAKSGRSAVDRDELPPGKSPSGTSLAT